MVKKKKRVVKKKKVVRRRKKSSGEKILSTFVKKALMLGHNPDEIRQVALKKGWPKTVVERVLKSTVKTRDGKIKSYHSSKTEGRVNTGINALDSLLQGGLRKESTNLVAGPAGSGKTLFGVKFLMQGIKEGKSGMYITFEENKEGFFKNMLQFGWDLKRAEIEGRFVFVYVNPEQAESIIEGGSGEAIKELIDECNVGRLVVDSMTSFSLLRDGLLERKESNLALFDLLRKWKCTSVLTVNDDLFDKHEELEFESDGIILLYHVKKRGKRVRALEVLKMRGTKIPEETFPMKITRRGITIDPHKAITF